MYFAEGLQGSARYCKQWANVHLFCDQLAHAPTLIVEPQYQLEEGVTAALEARLERLTHLCPARRARERS